MVCRFGSSAGSRVASSTRVGIGRQPVGRLLAYESRLELARIMLADFSPDVVGIAAQPFQVIGRDGGRLRRHVPDLLLVNANGLVTVVDVKPASRLELPKVREVFDWTARLCALRGWSLRCGPARTHGCWRT